ncbi:hypothetical protein CPAR01_03406 [Colletotrichum paranaense]|uniref:Uncharacterized protein n=1 Tax=Colletotrichum paranaense TaxID=1914294 RepID=A0ABQ9T341_9PEZI|nr:uncharacterized protein CPAR01_03406 [Colletotrichum paranaense]KAK1545904.1 hypothetical protein CPAR01_03406 [Colletotrichum paranaense]
MQPFTTKAAEAAHGAKLFQVPQCHMASVMSQRAFGYPHPIHQSHGVALTDSHAFTATSCEAEPKERQSFHGCAGKMVFRPAPLPYSRTWDEQDWKDIVTLTFDDHQHWTNVQPRSTISVQMLILVVASCPLQIRTFDLPNVETTPCDHRRAEKEPL